MESPAAHFCARRWLLAPSKKLGQHFLRRQSLAERIVRAAGVLDGQVVIEVGPGMGMLTRSLLASKAKKIVALEYDRRCIEHLQPLVSLADGRLEIIHADALNYDLASLGFTQKVVVANLPYNIATAMLVRWLRSIDLFTSLTLMFQHEVARCLTAQVGSSSYGRLSVIASWRTTTQSLFAVEPFEFNPPPKVRSRVLRLTPRVWQRQVEWSALERVTRAAFGQRRKMLRSSLQSLWRGQSSARGQPASRSFDAHNTLTLLTQAGVDPNFRAQELSPDDYLTLAQLWQEMRPGI